MCKECKVTGLGKPVDFLVIVMYAKESIRLMKFKQNPYFNRKRTHGKALFDQDLYEKVSAIKSYVCFQFICKLESNLYLRGERNREI